VSRIAPVADPGSGYEFAWDGTCVNTETQWEFLVNNRGDAAARNVVLNLTSVLGTYTYIREGTIEIDTADGRFPQTIGVTVDSTLTTLLDTADFPGGILTHCFDRLDDTAGMMPIKNYRLFISEFDTGQNFVIRFKTWRCCADDNAYNTGVDFNRWRMPVTYRDCQNTYNASVVGASNASWLHDSYVGDTGQVTQTYRAFNYDNPAYGAISSHLYDADSYDDLELVQEFQQNVSDLTGQHGGGCGGSQMLSIKNMKFSSLAPSEYDTQLFTDGGANTAGGVVGTNPRGQFMIEFQTDTGVQLDLAHVPTITKGGYVWYPVTFNATTPYTVTAVFDMDDLPSSVIATSNDFRNFFINSFINFWLMGCCPMSNPEPNITVNTLFNPEINGKSCDACFVPLSQVDFDIQLHCPGCVTPGIIITEFELDRINLGFRDSDDDGIADGGTPTFITSGYGPLDSLWVNTKGSIVGDTLEGRAQAFLVDGDPSDGFSYSGWQAYWDSANGGSPAPELSHIYFEQTISNTAATGLHCIGAQLRYMPVGTGTFLSYSLPGISPNSPLAPNAQGRLLFHIPLDSISSSVAITAYDSFEMVTRYVLCHNPSTEQELSVNNYMYLSVSPLAQAFPFQMGTPEVGALYGEADSLHYAIDSTHIGPAGYDPDDAALFICEAYAGSHYVYPVSTFYDEDWNNNPPDCGKSATIEAGYHINGPYRNMFPYEYRLMPRIDEANWGDGPVLADSLPVRFRFILPQGYRAAPAYSYTESYTYINSIQNPVVNTRTAGYQVDTGVSLIGPFSRDYRLDLNKARYALLQETGLSLAPSGSVVFNPPNNNILQIVRQSGDTILFMGDEMFRQGVVWNITPICSLAAQRKDTISAGDAFAVIPQFDSVCGNPNPERVLDKVDSFTLSIPNPNINASVLTPVFYGATADFPIRMSTSSGTVSNLIYYMQVNQNSLPSGVSIGCLGADTSCVNPYTVTTVFSGADTFTRFTLGTLSTAADTFYLRMHFSNCDSLGKTLHLPLYYFWSCDEVEGDLPADGNLCDIPDTLLLNYTMPNLTFVRSQSISAGPYSTCTDINYTVNLNVSSQGGMGGFTASVVLPEHITVVSAALRSGSNNSSYAANISANGQALMSGDTLWTFDMNVLTAFHDTSWAGIDGVNNNNASPGLSLRLKLRADCHLDMIDTVKIVLDANLYCGDTYRQYAEKADTVYFPDSLMYVFNPIVLTNGCGPYVTAGMVNPCYSPVGFTTSLGPYGTSPLDTLWQPAAPNFSAPDTGTYYITVTDGNGCSESDTFTVWPVLKPAITSNTGSFCLGMLDTLFVDSLPITFNGSILWSTNDTGTFITGFGSGQVRVRVTDQAGCIKRDTVWISDIEAY
jgi:hypothetical protein